MPMASVMQRRNFCSPASPTDNKELKLMEFCLIGHLPYVEFLKVVSWDHSYLTYLLMNFVARIASLRLYADDTTTYTSATNTTALELSFNQDLRKLSTWFSSNYLTVKHTKTQAMIFGNIN